MSARLPVVQVDAYAPELLSPEHPYHAYPSYLDIGGEQELPHTHLHARGSSASSRAYDVQHRLAVAADQLALSSPLLSTNAAASPSDSVRANGLGSKAGDALLRSWRFLRSEHAVVYVACFWLLTFWVANNVRCSTPAS